MHKKHKIVLSQICEFALTFLQVANGLVIVLQLKMTLAQEEVGLD